MHKDGQLNGKTGLDVGVEDNPYYLRRRRQETAEPEAVTQTTDAVNVQEWRPNAILWTVYTGNLLGSCRGGTRHRQIVMGNITN